MKKYLLGLAVLLMGTSVMTSCDPAEDYPETYLQVYSTGAYVVNSGNMYNKIESSLTAIDYASSTATQNVFKTANGRSLGNTANDGIVYGNKIYLAVDQSNTVEVIDKTTKKSIKQIKTTDLLGNAEGAEPRHIIAGDGKVYFTTYGGYVAAVDTTDFALQKKWQVGNYPEGLVIGNGNLYVANSNYGAGAGNISCINLSNDNVETKNIEGVNNPTSIYYASGRVYVIDNPVYGPAPDYATTGENALRVVLFDEGKSQKVADGNYAVCVTPGAATTARTSVEVVRPHFFVLNTPYGGTPSVSVLVAGSTQAQAMTLSEMPVSPCGIFADPLNGHIFVLSYKMGDNGYADYNGNGYVVEYDSAGQKQHEYATGVGSCAMFFDSAYKTAYTE